MTSSVHIGLQGLRDAVELLRPTKNTIEGAAAVGSGAFWACALDEQLRAADGTYDERRDIDEQGQLMPGIRLVRNAVTHGAVVALEQRPGLVFPVTFPTTFEHLAYRPLADLLASWVGHRDERRDNARQDRIYSERLVGLPVIDPLVDAFEWFLRETSIGLDQLP
ncbi:hypothetical protein [Curtobacterium flaccumfaciens]|uniref:hypothetical protein n=1 Tax=Curtobacterium flaccumfaciens TaxID=2035 RepID=UPI003879C4C2